MQSSPDIDKIAIALSKAQGQMGTAKKGDTATVTNQKTGRTYTYNYATLESIVDALRVPFSENELAFTQLPVFSESDAVIVETVLLHSSGQWISNTIRIPVAVSDAHGFGSALTYACKYGLRAAAGIPTSEDDDGAAATKAKPRATEAEMMPRATGTHAPPSIASSTVPLLVDTKPEGGFPTQGSKRVTFEFKKGQYTTAGMTKEQFISSLDLAKTVTVKYKDPNKAHTLLIKEFGVTSRSELTEETAAQYLARLKELADSE